jgi:hypothetical protein
LFGEGPTAFVELVEVVPYGEYAIYGGAHDRYSSRLRRSESIKNGLNKHYKVQAIRVCMEYLIE